MLQYTIIMALRNISNSILRPLIRLSHIVPANTFQANLTTTAYNKTTLLYSSNNILLNNTSNNNTKRRMSSQQVNNAAEVKVGDSVPSNVTLYEFKDGIKEVNSGELLGKGKVVLFGLPGMYPHST